MKASELIIHVPVEQIKKIGETESMNSISRETEHFELPQSTDPSECIGARATTATSGPSRLPVVSASFCTNFLQFFRISSVNPPYLKFPLFSPKRDFSSHRHHLQLQSCSQELHQRNQLDRRAQRKVHSSGPRLHHPVLRRRPNDRRERPGCAALGGRHRLQRLQREHGRKLHDQRLLPVSRIRLRRHLQNVFLRGKTIPLLRLRETDADGHGKMLPARPRERAEGVAPDANAGGRRKRPPLGSLLQIIADFHREEEIGVGNDRGLLPLFMNEFENGFRYFVHTRETIPYLATEGISVSPGARVYSAISSQKNSGAFIGSSCLSFKRELRAPGRELVGNCTNEWPPNYKTTVPYSATNCRALCRAAFFNSKCGCAPFIYNLGKKYDVCTPYDIFSCINKEFNIKDDPDGYTKLKLPQCSECKVECESWLYHTYNSYGQGFSVGALKWLQKKNANWTAPHVKSNFVAINIFFRDMSFTQYMQVQSVSLTQTFSDIGGNMGMFMGMSLLSIIEVVIWLSKISWVAISKKRRHYLVDKKTQEKEREKRLEETLKSRSATECTDDSIASSTREKLKRIAGSFRRKSVAAFDGVQHGIPTCSLRRRRFAKIGTSTTITPTGLSRYPLRRRPNRLGASWIRSSTRSCTELGERDERIAGRRPQLIRCWN
ncbi:hypothetical protein L596_008347 [Steinernema carpocapsae]|uniref:Uncharacterized protein n=1 Tax=Steinernema carpocapsae TaxID=34508 RepID=A0A4U5PCA8_STECR|nr:hypothetical protein L596_008347 [Steinernema carpocapsae]